MEFPDTPMSLYPGHLPVYVEGGKAIKFLPNEIGIELMQGLITGVELLQLHYQLSHIHVVIDEAIEV